MRTEVLTDADAVARTAATLIAAESRKAVAARGRFVMAVSGGHTPWVMADPPPTLTSHHRQEMSGTVLSVGHTLKLDLIMEES